MNPSSEEVGDKFAAALGDGPSRATLAAQRVHVMEMAQRSFGRRARPNFRALTLAFVAIAGVATAFAMLLPREPSFEARFRGNAVLADAPLVTDERASTLDFSDGSQVVLEPRARATLSELGPSRAGLRVDRGKISASIHKHGRMTWTISAGPYAVHVVGTEFSVEWSAHERALEVLVRKGRVRVTGGDLPKAGIVLDAGGRLERRTQPAAPEQVVSTDVIEPTRIEKTTTGKSATVEPIASSAASISALATKGKYKEALALAERQGFDRLTNELPENDLLLLANAARFSGDAKRARVALLKVRQRFQGRPAADLAALYLAKIAEDMTHEPQEAVRWLRTFLSGSPSGDLAAGARASLMSLLLRAGDKLAARAVAEDYLRYHSSGPHAEDARALVRE